VVSASGVDLGPRQLDLPLTLPVIPEPVPPWLEAALSSV
jgi:hypothetical protein